MSNDKIREAFEEWASDEFGEGVSFELLEDGEEYEDYLTHGLYQAYQAALNHRQAQREVCKPYGICENCIKKYCEKNWCPVMKAEVHHPPRHHSRRMSR